MTAKYHLLADGGEHLRVSACGLVLVAVTTARADVTCALCRRLMHAEADPSSRYVDALLTQGAAPRPPHTSPIMTRERWQRWKSGCSHPATACRQCELCKHFQAIEIEQHSSPWRRRHKVTEERPRWRSVSEALREYATVQLDGYPGKSATGAMDALHAMGAFIQQGDDTRMSPALRAASDLVHVEEALRNAFDEYTDRGMGARECVSILVRAVVGRMGWAVESGRKVRRFIPEANEVIGDDYAFTEKQVRAIVRQGTKRVREQLEARGLMQERIAP